MNIMQPLLHGAQNNNFSLKRALSRRNSVAIGVHASAGYDGRGSAPQKSRRSSSRPSVQSGRGGGRGRGSSGPQQGPRQRKPPPEGSQQQYAPPKYDMLVVVEGVNDMKAVRRAVHADVYVLGTATRADEPSVHNDLKSLTQKYIGIVLLLDPDVAGRQARNMLNAALPECWHAFVPVPAATAAAATGFKEAGNVGIEHAPPRAIIGALKRRRRSESGRNEFTREYLQELGLIAVMHERGGNVTERRNLVCDYLGLGMCDGKQLLRQLNSYGFTSEDLSMALSWAETQLED